MDFTELINNDIKQAMLAKDKKKLEALRAIKAALLLIKTGKDIGTSEIPEDVELKTLQRLVKQRRESAELYKSQNRQDLYDDEVFQAEIIEAYLPQQLSPDEIRSIIKGIVEKTGANSIKDMGKIMGLASKEMTGKADNKTISAIVKEILGA